MVSKSIALHRVPGTKRDLYLAKIKFSQDPSSPYLVPTPNALSVVIAPAFPNSTGIMLSERLFREIAVSDSADDKNNGSKEKWIRFELVCELDSKATISIDAHAQNAGKKLFQSLEKYLSDGDLLCYRPVIVGWMGGKLLKDLALTMQTSPSWAVPARLYRGVTSDDDTAEEEEVQSPT